MPDYQKLVRLRPSFEEFFIHRDILHRGDVLFFPGNRRGEHFSTDRRGFRHTKFEGQDLSVAEILRRNRFGIVLGTSRAFGLGICGNENTIPSLLSERFGFPFANVSLPQGNSRNLFSLLYSYLVRVPKKPAAVVHFSTGDLTGFNYTSLSDPVFGAPNPKQLDIVDQERGGPPQPARSLEAMLAFTSLWTRAVAKLCQENGIPLVLPHDTSFFEKRQPSQWDVAVELGRPYYKVEKRWFEGHKEFAHRFYNRREGLADRLGIALAGPGQINNLGFIDEFHYDEDGCRSMADYIGNALEPQLKS